MAMSSVTGTSGVPLPSSNPSPTTCTNGQMLNLDYIGLNGTICAVSYPPNQLDISSCCLGSVRTANNCTQYCEIDADGTISNFGKCVQGRNNGTFLYSSCEEVSNSTRHDGGSGSDDDQTGGGTMLRSPFANISVASLLSLGFMTLILL